MEHTDLPVVTGHRALALEDPDLNGRLIVGSGGEHFGATGRDGGVGLDEAGHHTAEGLDSEGQRSHIKKEDILYVTCEDTALDGGAYSHDLVGVDALVGFLAEEVLHYLLDLGNAGGTAHEEDLVNIVCGKAGIAQGLAARLDAALEEVIAQLLEFSPGEGLHEVLGHSANRHDVRKVDFRGSLAGKLDLGFLGCFLQSLQCHGVALEVGPSVLGGELGSEPVDDLLVEVITAEVSIPVGALHFEHTVAQLHDGDIEGTATEVVHCDLHALVLLVKAVGEGGGSRLVDDSLNVQSRDLASFLGSLPLGVGEVCRNGDDSLGNFLAEVVLGDLLHLLENHCADFLGREFLALDVDAGSVVVAADHRVGNAGDFTVDLVVGLAHEPLDGEHGVLGVGDGLTLCGVADLALAALRESHYRRGSPLAFVVDYDRRLVTFHHCDAAVGGTEVDSDDFSHDIVFFCFRYCLFTPASILGGTQMS